MTVFLVHCWCSRSMPLHPEFLPVESLTPSPHKVEGTQFLSTHCPFFPDEQRAWDLPRDPQPAPLNPYLCLYLGFLLIDSYWLGWPGSVFTGSLLASGNPALKSTFLPVAQLTSLPGELARMNSSLSLFQDTWEPVPSFPPHLQHLILSLLPLTNSSPTHLADQWPL